MKFPVTILAVCIPFLSVLAQSSAALTGKWKVIGVDDGVYHNYLDNTNTVHEEFAKSYTGKADSALAIAMFTQFAERYNDYFFVFMKDGKFREIQNGKVRNELSTYRVDTLQKLILVDSHQKENQAEGKIRFEFKDQHLQLTLPAPSGEEMIILLDKTN